MLQMIEDKKTANSQITIYIIREFAVNILNKNYKLAIAFSNRLMVSSFPISSTISKR